MSDIKFGAAVIYVPEGAKEVLDFYSRVFGLSICSYDSTYDFGELDTGESTIAIASDRVGEFIVDKRLVGICHHFALFLVAMLRFSTGLPYSRDRLMPHSRNCVHSTEGDNRLRVPSTVFNSVLNCLETI